MAKFVSDWEKSEKTLLKILSKRERHAGVWIWKTLTAACLCRRFVNSVVIHSIDCSSINESKDFPQFAKLYSQKLSTSWTISLLETADSTENNSKSFHRFIHSHCTSMSSRMRSTEKNAPLRFMEMFRHFHRILSSNPTNFFLNRISSEKSLYHGNFAFFHSAISSCRLRVRHMMVI